MTDNDALDMSNPEDRQLAESIGSRAPWGDLPSEHKSIIRMMNRHFGPPNEKLSGDLASRMSYANTPKFWRDIWKSWGGQNEKMLDYVITEVMQRGRSIQDKFSVRTFEQILQMPQYTQHGEALQLTYWEKKCGILEEVSSKAPAHETDDEMRTSAQTLARYGANFKAPLAFPTSPHLLQRYQMELDATTKSCLKTWMFLVVRSLVREGQLSAYETLKRDHKVRMSHGDFVTYWRYINNRTFCFAKDGTAMDGLETKVCSEMSRTRTVKPTSVLTAIGSARFMEFIKEHRTHSVAGAASRLVQPNDTNDDAALNLSRLGRTPTYQLELDESIVFTFKGSDKEVDPMKHIKFVSQFALMCPMWQPTRDDTTYHTERRSIEVLDASTNLLARLSLRNAFHFSSIFHVGTPLKLTSHGHLILIHLCKEAGKSGNSIQHRLRDGLSGQRSDFDTRSRSYGRSFDDENERKYSDEDEDDDEDDDDDSDLLPEDKIRQRKDREFRKFMTDDDAQYSFTPDDAGNHMENLSRTGRLSTVDELGKGVNFYNLCMAQGVLAQVVRQLLDKPTTVSKMLRMVGSQRDDTTNQASRKMQFDQYSKQRQTMGHTQGPRGGMGSVLAPIMEPMSAMSPFAAAKRAGLMGNGYSSTVPTTYVTMSGTEPANISMSRDPPANVGPNATVVRAYGSNPVNLNVVHPVPQHPSQRYRAPQGQSQPQNPQQQQQQQQRGGAAGKSARVGGPKHLQTTLFNFLVLDKPRIDGLPAGADNLIRNFIPKLDFDPEIVAAIRSISAAMHECIEGIEAGRSVVDATTTPMDHFLGALVPIATSAEQRKRLLAIWGKTRPDETTQRAAVAAADDFMMYALKANFVFAMVQHMVIKYLSVEPSAPHGGRAAPSDWEAFQLQYEALARDGTTQDFAAFDSVLTREIAQLRGVGPFAPAPTGSMVRALQLVKTDELHALRPKRVPELPKIDATEDRIWYFVTKIFGHHGHIEPSDAASVSMFSALISDQSTIASAGIARSDQDNWVETLIGDDSVSGATTSVTRMTKFRELVSKIAMATSIPDQYIVDAIMSWKSIHSEVEHTRMYPFLDNLARKCEDFSRAAINNLFDTPKTKLRIRTMLSELALTPNGNSAFEEVANSFVENATINWATLDSYAKVVLQDEAYHPNAQQMFDKYRLAGGGKSKRRQSETNPIGAKRGYNDYRTTDPQQIERLMMRVRLTRPLFDLLLDDNIIFPMSFIIFRMAIEIESGATIFYVKGDPTGFLCIHDAHVLYSEEMYTEELLVQVKFEANLLVHAPENISFIPDTYPMAYKRGGGITYFSIDTDSNCFFASSDALRADLHSFAVDYNYVPRDTFLSIYGKCDNRIYQSSGDNGDMYPTAAIYRSIWRIPNPSQEEAADQHILSPHFYHFAEPKKLWLAFRCFQTVFTDTIDGKSYMKKIDGEDAMGRISVNGDIGIIGGVDEFGGNGLVPMGRAMRK